MRNLMNLFFFPQDAGGHYGSETLWVLPIFAGWKNLLFVGRVGHGRGTLVVGGRGRGRGRGRGVTNP